jgi:ER lumen protein retaining receptor
MNRQSVNWNIFRYTGDYLHLFAIMQLLRVNYQDSKISSMVSLKTQMLLLAVYLFRYIEFGYFSQMPYLLIFKSAFIGITGCTAYLVFNQRRQLAIKAADDANIFLLLGLAMTFWFLFSERNHSFYWQFSEYLEAIALIPQYLMLFEQSGSGEGNPEELKSYIHMMGMYRVFYAFNWIYKRSVLGAAYEDFTSWSAGVLDILFFIDFLTNKGFIRNPALRINGTFNKVQDSLMVEMKVKDANYNRFKDSMSFDKERVPIIEQL